MDAADNADLCLQHPDETPQIVGWLPYLIHPPSRLAPTASWLRFRDKTVRPAMAGRPDDPNLPRFLAQVETVLAWRATIPAAKRFWKPDPPDVTCD